ncbi:MAG: SGNH/GDSL hydrolase family protein [Victivallaceae bacterium]|nr:SGNH/GDSL hydrolase family protein [Victivallaceae bacterium]
MKNLSEIDRNMAVAEATENLRWLDADAPPMRLSGMAFRKAGEKFFRVPQQGLPPDVMYLGRCTAGVQLAFKTDSTKISVRVTLDPPIQMDHMASTGSCGFDLYCGTPGARRYFGCARFAVSREKPDYTAEIVGGMKKEMREYLVNFPLYSGIKSFELGLDSDAKVEAPSPWSCDRPIVWYGTSITQGGCASRPGMAATNILSRKWNRPILNFGFSGSGKGEHSVAGMLAEIQTPAMYILDYEANAKLPLLQKTLDGVIGTLRAKHPEVPIVVLSRSIHCKDFYLALDTDAARDFQRETVERRRASGDENIYFINGSPEIPGTDEWTVDGIHLTDNGFARQAEYLAPQLEKILQEKK